jgi:hypothetical protein
MTLVQKSFISMAHFGLSVVIQFLLFTSFCAESWGGAPSSVGKSDFWMLVTWIVNPFCGAAWTGMTSDIYGFGIYILLALVATFLGTFVLAIIIEFIDRNFMINLIRTKQ